VITGSRDFGLCTRAGLALNSNTLVLSTWSLVVAARPHPRHYIMLSLCNCLSLQAAEQKAGTCCSAAQSCPWTQLVCTLLLLNLLWSVEFAGLFFNRISLSLEQLTTPGWPMTTGHRCYEHWPQPPRRAGLQRGQQTDSGVSKHTQQPLCGGCT
jgi:hypothetical protein